MISDHKYFSLFFLRPRLVWGNFLFQFIRYLLPHGYLANIEIRGDFNPQKRLQRREQYLITDLLTESTAHVSFIIYSLIHLFYKLLSSHQFSMSCNIRLNIKLTTVSIIYN